MQRMSPHIPPKPIQTHLRRRRPCPCDFKNPTRYPECGIRSNDLDARHPLRHLPPLGGAYVPLFAVVEVDVADFLAGNVSKGFGGAEVCEEGAVALQDVGFVHTSGNGSGSVGPGTGVFWLCRKRRN